MSAVLVPALFCNINLAPEPAPVPVTVICCGVVVNVGVPPVVVEFRVPSSFNHSIFGVTTKVPAPTHAQNEPACDAPATTGKLQSVSGLVCDDPIRKLVTLEAGSRGCQCTTPYGPPPVKVLSSGVHSARSLVMSHLKP